MSFCSLLPLNWVNLKQRSEICLLSVQVPCVEVNALMKTFQMKPLLFPVSRSSLMQGCFSTGSESAGSHMQWTWGCLSNLT